MAKAATARLYQDRNDARRQQTDARSQLVAERPQAAERLADLKVQQAKVEPQLPA